MRLICRLHGRKVKHPAVRKHMSSGAKAIHFPEDGMSFYGYAFEAPVERLAAGARLLPVALYRNAFLT